MKDFEFYKKIRLHNFKKKDDIFNNLKEVYSRIPKTKGCMENIKSEKGCNGWCCRVQTPQLLYSEFLLIWDHVSKNWDDDEICDLLEKSMMNAVDKLPSKGCVFFDEDKCLCRVHGLRSYNCRIYGITPDEEFSPRYEKLKEEYKSIVGAVIKPQCELVSIADDSVFLKKDVDNLWKEMVAVEREAGIPDDIITDSFGGSYRTPHDHVLLYNMPENVLNSLSGIKLYSDHLDKIVAIKDIIAHIRSFFKDNHAK